ncbi:MAG: hypothetical protein AAF604_05205 [Acidobacteriota bacterium]
MNRLGGLIALGLFLLLAAAPLDAARKSQNTVPIFVYVDAEDSGVVALEVADRYQARDAAVELFERKLNKRLRVVSDPGEARLFLALGGLGRADGFATELPTQVSTTVNSRGSSATATSETLQTDHCLLEARLWSASFDETLRAVVGTQGGCWWSNLGTAIARRADKWAKKNPARVAAATAPVELPAAVQGQLEVVARARTVHLFSRDPETSPGGWRAMKPKLAVAGFRQAAQEKHRSSLRWSETAEAAEIVIEITAARAGLTNRSSATATVGDHGSAVMVQNQYRNAIDFEIRLSSGESLNGTEVTFTSPLPNALSLGHGLAERLAHWVSLMSDEVLTQARVGD